MILGAGFLGVAGGFEEGSQGSKGSGGVLRSSVGLGEGLLVEGSGGGGVASGGFERGEVVKGGGVGGVFAEAVLHPGAF